MSDSYVMVLKDEAAAGRVRASAAHLSRAYGGRLGAIYEHALRGFSVRMNEAAAEALSRHPAVACVEEDGMVETAATQQNAPWGLDRIDQHTLPLSTTYTYGSTGAGVRAHIIDGGILTTHEEFEGRASVAPCVARKSGGRFRRRRSLPSDGEHRVEVVGRRRGQSVECAVRRPVEVVRRGRR